MSENTDLPCLSVSKAENTLSRGDEIIFMSWVCAGKITGLSKALKRYCVKAVCAVGMTVSGNEINSQLKNSNKIDNAELFYLQGGFDYNKLHGLYKFVMKLIRPMLIKELQGKKDKVSSEALDTLQNGNDFVREINLRDIIVWYHKNK